MQEASSNKGFPIAPGRLLIYSVIFLITFIPFVLATNYIDLDHPALAFDWRNSFHGAIWLKDFGWTSRPFRTPPWAVWYFLPITALPFKLGWAVMTYLSTVTLVLSVPRKPSRNLWIGGTFLLLTAHPVLRNFADVNLEAFVIAGLMFCLYAFKDKKVYWLSAGILLASIKPQSIFLVFAVMGLYMLQTYHWKEIAKVVAICGGIFVITMLIWAQAWLGSTTTVPEGISLTAGLATLKFPPYAILIAQILVAGISVFVAWRDKSELDRTKIGLLVGASILSSPYANALSVVPLLAFGGIAIFMKYPLRGIFIFVLFNLPFVQIFGFDRFTAVDTVYFLLVQLITWLILLIEVYRQSESYRSEAKAEIEETQ